MAYCTVNGSAVLKAHITLPRVGVWHADFVMADGSQPQGRVTVNYGGALGLKGTVRYGGQEEGMGELHVVAGAGGWPAPMPPKAYRNAPRRNVVSDILAAAGESLSQSSSNNWLTTQLPFWNILQTTAGVALQLLVQLQEGVSWRMLPDGSLFVGTEAWPKVSISYEVLERRPRDYAMRIDTETPYVLPGATFAGQRVSAVEYVLTAEDRHAVLHFEGPNS